MSFLFLEMAEAFSLNCGYNCTRKCHLCSGRESWPIISLMVSLLQMVVSLALCHPFQDFCRSVNHLVDTFKCSYSLQIYGFDVIGRRYHHHHQEWESPFLQLLGELMAMDPAPSKGNGFLYSRFLVLMTAGMSYWIFATYFTWDMVWT